MAQVSFLYLSSYPPRQAGISEQVVFEQTCPTDKQNLFVISSPGCLCIIQNTFLQVYSVVDEMFLAGEIRETSQTKVLKQLLMLSSLE